MTYRSFVAMLINLMALVTVAGLLYFVYGAETPVDRTSVKHLLSLGVAVFLPALLGAFTSVLARKNRGSQVEMLTVISRSIGTDTDEKQRSKAA